MIKITEYNEIEIEYILEKVCNSTVRFFENTNEIYNPL